MYCLNATQIIDTAPFFRFWHSLNRRGRDTENHSPNTHTLITTQDYHRGKFFVRFLNEEMLQFGPMTFSRSRRRVPSWRLGCEAAERRPHGAFARTFGKKQIREFLAQVNSDAQDTQWLRTIQIAVEEDAVPEKGVDLTKS